MTFFARGFSFAGVARVGIWPSNLAQLVGRGCGTPCLAFGGLADDPGVAGAKRGKLKLAATAISVCWFLPLVTKFACVSAALLAGQEDSKRNLRTRDGCKEWFQ